MKPKIILASTSPRRSDLLKQIGLDFEIIPSQYVEDMGLELDNIELAKELACGKAKDVADKLTTGIVIGSDTFIVFNTKRIGKPKNAAEAQIILKMLSGQWIEIYSGLAIIDTEKKKEITDYEITKVKIKSLTDEEITSYIATGEPLDKAGAFAIQGKGAIFIEKIDGCYSNVIGLPLYKLYMNLQKMGINII